MKPEINRILQDEEFGTMPLLRTTMTKEAWNNRKDDRIDNVDREAMEHLHVTGPDLVSEMIQKRRRP